MHYVLLSLYSCFPKEIILLRCKSESPFFQKALSGTRHPAIRLLSALLCYCFCNIRCSIPRDGSIHLNFVNIFIDVFPMYGVIWTKLKCFCSMNCS